MAALQAARTGPQANIMTATPTAIRHKRLLVNLVEELFISIPQQ
jgi:hypothetical protein